MRINDFVVFKWRIFFKKNGRWILRNVSNVIMSNLLLQNDHWSLKKNSKYCNIANRYIVKNLGEVNEWKRCLAYANATVIITYFYLYSLFRINTVWLLVVAIVFSIIIACSFVCYQKINESFLQVLTIPIIYYCPFRWH